MYLGLIASLGDEMIHASTIDELREALARAAYDLGFERFALSLEIGRGSDFGTSVLIHDYPPSWADMYIGFNLGLSDPIRRAGENSLTGFTWQQVPRLIPITERERTTYEAGIRHGIADGYTVPRHLPGETSGSCSFVIGPDGTLPESRLPEAEILGATALASARRVSGSEAWREAPQLTDRQRDCVLWAARNKTDWEIGGILGISRNTVVQHLRDARKRYNAIDRRALILAVIYGGLISFADIFRWRDDR